MCINSDWGRLKGTTEFQGGLNTPAPLNETLSCFTFMFHLYAKHLVAKIYMEIN